LTTLKPAYLIHGDDHGAIGERRARLKALAEAAGDASSVEMLEGEAASPEGVAGALSTMTFALGRRVIVVDGAERFKEADVQTHVAPAMKDMPPDTTIAFFGREEARYKVPAALHAAVKSAKGQIVAERAVKPWELADWVREQAQRHGLALDAHAARALIAQIGERQQRLVRELEKLALQNELSDQPIKVSAEEIERNAARSAVSRTFALADALVGRDAPAATHTYLRLRSQGERLSGLLYLMASRLREAETISLRLAAGEPPVEIKRSLRMPSRAADRLIGDVARTEPDQLREALCRIADVEVDSRGGPPLSGSRTPLSSLEEDTLALRAILAIAS
jgi:DNA polymerase III subunit delta